MGILSQKKTKMSEPKPKKKLYSEAQEEVISQKLRQLKDGVKPHSASEEEMLIKIAPVIQTLDIPVIAPTSGLTGQIEITKSYSYKLQMERVAGPALRYESSDFFTAAKTSCQAEDAERMSEIVFAFCKAECLKDVRKKIREYREDENFIFDKRTA